MTDALFDVPADQVKPVRQPPPPSNGRITWTKYRPKKPLKCDDCLHVLAEAHGHAPAARMARWRRVQGGGDRLVCSAHMTQRREDEGLAPLKDDRKAI